MFGLAFAGAKPGQEEGTEQLRRCCWPGSYSCFFFCATVARCLFYAVFVLRQYRSSVPLISVSSTVGWMAPVLRGPTNRVRSWIGSVRFDSVRFGRFGPRPKWADACACRGEGLVDSFRAVLPGLALWFVGKRAIHSWRCRAVPVPGGLGLAWMNHEKVFAGNAAGKVRARRSRAN